jgi:hypothetical protein
MDVQAVIEFIEKHGLVNKVIDKLLSPESLRAIAEGAAAGAIKASQEKNK